jgi:hypothetical protein
MQLTKDGITIEIPAKVILNILLPETSNLHAKATSLPQIGEPWGGGIYAGLTIHDNQLMALVLLPYEEKLNWKDALAWAEKQGGVLPSRIDQLVLLQNLKGEFQDAYYWSCEQYRADSDYAWVQHFGYGSQSCNRIKSSAFPVRVVRRLLVIR